MNAQQELYLTDVIGILRAEGDAVVRAAGDADEAAGVNSRSQLAEWARLFDEGRASVGGRGRRDRRPATTYIDCRRADKRATPRSCPHVSRGRTTVGEGAEVGPHAHRGFDHRRARRRCRFAVVRESTVGPEASVGPFASLRPGTDARAPGPLGSSSSRSRRRSARTARTNHLAYLGDAEIGPRCLTSAPDDHVATGTVRPSNKTIIERRGYIGSDTMRRSCPRRKAGGDGRGSVVREDVRGRTCGGRPGAHQSRAAATSMNKAESADSDEESSDESE